MRRGDAASNSGLMRLLVTGSAGLVGRALCAELEAAGHEVVPFDVAEDPACDIRNPERVAVALQGCDGILHLAAVSRVAWGEADPSLCHDVNVAGTEAVMAAARTQPVPPWLVFVSSREVYGNPRAFPVGEGAEPAPINVYGRSKRAAELAVRRCGLRTAVVRLSNVYGTEHDHPDRAVPSLLMCALHGADLVVTGADVFFDFVHVDDCVRGLILVAGRLARGQDLPPLHLVTGRRTSLRDLAQAAREAANNSASPIVERPARSFDVLGFVGDPALAREVLGFGTAIGLEDGLVRLKDRLLESGAMAVVTKPLHRA